MLRKRWMIGCAVFGVAAIIAILPCMERVRDHTRWGDAQNDMRQVGIAFWSYHEAHGHLPPAIVRDKEGKPLYSWRVLLLPYLEQDRLYRQFHLDEPWDSPHNKALLLERAPRPYHRRRYSLGDDESLTSMLVLVDPAPHSNNRS